MSKNVVLGQIIIFAQTVFAQTAARDQLCGGNSTLSEKIDGCELLESTYWRASQPVCFATHPTAEDPGGSKCILESNKMKICVTFFLFYPTTGDNRTKSPRPLREYSNKAFCMHRCSIPNMKIIHGQYIKWIKHTIDVTGTKVY